MGKTKIFQVLSVICLPAAVIAVLVCPGNIRAESWPMWRYDSARSADPSRELPEELHLQWVRELPAPMPAWRPQADDRGKLDFDLSYSPVAADGMVFVPSSTTDSVTAYNLENGEKIWRFFADGPVRLAPAFDDGRLFFASDDGYLYCLDAAEGSLKWKFQAGPSSRRLLGNERLINFWAARGAPLALEGRVYFAAGLWPLHGVFIYALDAESGEPAWVNDTTGSNFVGVPRGSVYGGIVPQGYLAVSDGFPEEARDRLGRPVDGDYLVVSGGRAGPVFLDRLTGEVAADLFNVTSLLRSKSAGGYAVHGINGGGIGKRSNPMLEKRVESVSEFIDGEVFYKLSVGDRLVVSAENGTIYCFGPEEREPVRHEYRPEELEPGSARWAQSAGEVLEALGESGGYGLMLGAGSGDLLREIIRQGDQRMVVVEDDSDTVRALREELDRAGVYGLRASVIEADPAGFEVQPYLFSLILSEDMTAAGIDPSVESLEKILDRLRPYGGVARLGFPSGQARVFQETADFLEVDRVSVEIIFPGLLARIFDAGEGYLSARRTGPLTGAGRWTHQHHDEANTLISHEERVKLPLGVLWFGGPNNHNVLGIHSRGPRPQVVGGRQVFLGVDTIAARCVYTGRELWEREFPGIGNVFDTRANITGTTYIGSPLVTLEDNVYLRFEGRVHRLDAASGETLDIFSLPGRSPDEIRGQEDNALDWGHLSVRGDFLVATSEPYYHEDQEMGRYGSYTGTASRLVSVMNRHDGEVYWTRRSRTGFRHNTIISDGQTLFLIDGLPESQLALLARRGIEPEEQRLSAIDLETGEEKWALREGVFGTFLLYCAEKNILVEGGSHDKRHSGANLEDEPTRAAGRCGDSGEILWRNDSFLLPAAVRGDMLISASRFNRRAISLSTGERWRLTQPLTGEEKNWGYHKSKNCDSLNASPNLLLFRATYAAFYDLERQSGVGYFSGFRSGCTSNMIAADGVLNALDYTRMCSCSYPHQTSLALVHMPDDYNIEFWTHGSAADPDPRGYGVNFGAPGRRFDPEPAALVWHPEDWHPEDGVYRRHPSVIRETGGSLPWVLSSLKEISDDDNTVFLAESAARSYTVRVHFAELNPEVTAGQRVFDLYVDGEKVFSGLDIVDRSGGAFRGVVSEFTVDNDGEAIRFTFRRADGSLLPPIVNGIELVARDQQRERGEAGD